jgi:hypothetical protein
VDINKHTFFRAAKIVLLIEKMLALEKGVEKKIEPFYHSIKKFWKNI